MRDLSALAREARALAVLGLPLIGGHMAQISMHITDTVMLGWYSVEALAAVVLGATGFFVLFIVGSGFAWAVMPKVAAANANGDAAEVRRTTRMALWLSLIFGAAVMPLLWFSGPLLRALGQDDALAAAAEGYLRIAGWGIFPALIVMVLKSYLAALERTGVVLWATVAGAVLNALLNWALIFGNWGAPELGVTGAAIATLATQLLTLGLTAGYAALHPALRRYTLFVRFWRPDWGAFAAVFRLGWPIGLTSLAESGLFAASALMMGWVGTQELAAHGIALEIVSLIFMIHVGLANAATIRAGQAHGRVDTAGLRLVAATGLALVLGIALLAVVLFLVAPEPLIGLFLSPDDPARPAILAIGASLLAVAALFQLADAGQVMALGLLRGIQDTRVPMIYASVSYWLVGIPASYVLGFTLGWGGPGIWAGLAIGLALAFALLVWRFWHRAGAAAPLPA
ncbi:MAG: MATE family efflux transporter [Rhodobacteraceae bacterium]|jgi:MATE family multidrug resistance protein|nr:MATE family efflux transporter [Paracoccaceae bacterium]